MVEFFITQLFSSNCITSLIEILFNDMQSDAEKFEVAKAHAAEAARRDAMPPQAEEEKKAEEEAKAKEGETPAAEDEDAEAAEEDE